MAKHLHKIRIRTVLEKKAINEEFFKKLNIMSVYL